MRFFIGDVHGCAWEFEALIRKILKMDPKAEIYSVGDVVNKGPDTLRSLELTQEYNVKCILGNHEGWFLRVMQFPKSGMTEKQERYLANFRGEESKWFPVVKKWPLYRRWDDIDLVHAGLDPSVEKLKDMNALVVTRIRTWDGKGADLNRQGQDPAWFDCIKWKRKVVFGHWAQLGLVVKPKFIGLDSGCVYGGYLSAWCAETGQIIQVPAKRQYAMP